MMNTLEKIDKVTTNKAMNKDASTARSTRVTITTAVVIFLSVALAIVAAYMYGVNNMKHADDKNEDAYSSLVAGRKEIAQTHTTDCSRSLYLVSNKCQAVTVGIFDGGTDVAQEKAEWSKRLKAQGWPMVNANQKEYFTNQPATRVVSSSAVSYRDQGKNSQNIIIYVTDTMPAADGQEFQSTGIRFTDKSIEDKLESADPKNIFIVRLATDYYTIW